MKQLEGERYEVLSAGLGAHGLNPRAVQVMQESGIDMTSHTSDVIHPAILNRAAYVITLCGHAAEHGPVISNPNGIKRHWGFDDPAKATGTEEEIMQQVRAVRDAIRARIEQFLTEE
ncbi:arsenate reductase (thioredoxin) [Paenibacillus dendritiformis]|nr:arsenate reductase (thioredoxin) [Paenibacillus dendritiformis]